MVSIAGALPVPGAARALEADDSTPPSDRMAALRAEADDLAVRYFDTLVRSRALEQEIAQITDAVRQLRAQALEARDDARAKARSAYRLSSVRLPSIVTADSVLVAARRVHLIGRVAARDQAVYARARAAALELGARRRSLAAARQEQADTLARLRDESAAIDQKLALAQQQERAVLAARLTARAPADPPAVVAPTTTAPTPSAPAPPPDYTGTPGVHPRHDDPFLVCVRWRESNDDYSAVNPAGPYYGAYQFLQTTWNATANHAGRTELVGVRPDRATPYDQDDVAWALYQWQGAGPWGGACS